MSLFKGKITIARRTGGEKDRIVIHLEDVSSIAPVFSVEMSPEDFGNAIAGLAFRECEYELYGGVEVAGKVRQIERGFHTFKRNEFSEMFGYNKEKVKKWLIENKQREGWKLSVYLETQSAIKYIADGVLVYFDYIRYVDPK
jgi:hypothetical protein